MKTLLKSRALAPGAGGLLVEVTPPEAGWDLISFAVRRMVPGEVLRKRCEGEECCLVLLSGSGSVSLDGAPREKLGPRESVFDAYPHAVYVPHGHEVVLTAGTVLDLAECRTPSEARLTPRLVLPEDCGYEIRGGGNATRQIVDVLAPAFPADRLMICEVFTPSGNWSSYPPHKHDVDAPPLEADLEETYYYRMRGPAAYGFQRLYTADGRRDETLTVGDGDLVLIRDGYHPFVTAYGFDAYYLNVLAGNRRSLAASDDPRYAAFRASWPAPDPRLPVLPRPEPSSRVG